MTHSLTLVYRNVLTTVLKWTFLDSLTKGPQPDGCGPSYFSSLLDSGRASLLPTVRIEASGVIGILAVNDSIRLKAGTRDSPLSGCPAQPLSAAIHGLRRRALGGHWRW